MYESGFFHILENIWLNVQLKNRKEDCQPSNNGFCLSSKSKKDMLGNRLLPVHSARGI